VSADAASYVLDTSALIAMMEAEEGGMRVRQLIAGRETWITFMSLLELRYITIREHGQQAANQRYGLLLRSGATIIWQIDEPTLNTAAQFKADYPLSLGDAINAAYARQRQAILVHKDPEFEILKDAIALLALPYKVKGKS
jgi:predicted nucleic acid-binding protein